MRFYNESRLSTLTISDRVIVDSCVSDSSTISGAGGTIKQNDVCMYALTVKS